MLFAVPVESEPVSEAMPEICLLTGDVCLETNDVRGAEEGFLDELGLGPPRVVTSLG
jgi:hypothetical protein